jgi:hypothetical protein
MTPTDDRTAEPCPSLHDDCPPPPRFEWEWWQAEALERGLDEDFAALGRAVLREAVQHNWGPQLRVVCCGEVLDEVLFQAPRQARRLYEALLETDGLRVVFVEDGEETTSEPIDLGGFTL